jgi:hypothetical protein
MALAFKVTIEPCERGAGEFQPHVKGQAYNFASQENGAPNTLLRKSVTVIQMASHTGAGSTRALSNIAKAIALGRNGDFVADVTVSQTLDALSP